MMGDAGTWAGVGTALVALAVAYVTYRSQRGRKRIEYSVTTDTELLPGELAGELQVEHSASGISVTDPALAIVRIVNTGDLAIEPKDFETGLKVTLEDVDEIVSASCTATRPPDLKPKIEVAGGTARIDPVLINPEDMFELQLLSAGKANDIWVSGRVADLNILRRESLPYPPGSGEEGEMLGFDRFMWWILIPATIVLAGVALGPANRDQAVESQIAILAAALIVALVLYPVRVRYLVKRRRLWRPE